MSYTSRSGEAQLGKLCQFPDESPTREWTKEGAPTLQMVSSRYLESALGGVELLKCLWLLAPKDLPPLAMTRNAVYCLFQKIEATLQREEIPEG